MYKKRLVDKLLKEYREDFPAILIEGAKAVGKTSTCLVVSNFDFRLDDPDMYELLNASMDRIITRNSPVLIDEWQRLPAIWDYVKRCVDDGLPNGTLLLTGSSPNLYSNIHSGSGHIVRLKMRPFSIEEREMSPIKIRLSNFFSGNVPFSLDEETEITFADYLDEIFRSGYPGIRNRSERAIERAIGSYIDNIISHDFKENNILIRKPQSLKLWLQTYAAAAATTTAYKTITQVAMSQDIQSPTEKTASNYRELLSGMGIVEELQAWIPMGKLFSVLGRTPKHFLADPALVPSLLNFDKELVADGKAKSSSGVETEDVKHLNWLAEEVQEEFTVHKIILYMGKHAYIRKDGVFVVPAAMFGA